jgi:hypothetical protein
VIALATGGWTWWNSLPPSPDGSPVKVVAYAATEDFANLPSNEKQPYLDAMSADPGKFMEAARESKLTDEQRWEAMGNFMSARMEAQADAYFALEPGPARDQYLDNLIDQFDQRRAQWAANRGGENRGPGPGANAGQGRQRGEGGPGGRGGGRGGAERMKNRTEKTPPALRAKMAEFRKAMRDRRQARDKSR